MSIILISYFWLWHHMIVTHICQKAYIKRWNILKRSHSSVIFLLFSDDHLTILRGIIDPPVTYCLKSPVLKISEIKEIEKKVEENEPLRSEFFKTLLCLKHEKSITEHFKRKLQCHNLQNSTKWNVSNINH